MSKEYNDRWIKPLRPGVRVIVEADNFIEKLDGVLTETENAT